MQRQRFLQALLETPGRTRIDAVQFILNAQQGCLCLLVAAKVVGIGQAAIPARLLFVGEVANDVAALVKLASYNRTSISTILLNSIAQRLAAIDEIQMELSEVQPTAGQIGEQAVARSLILTGALMKAKNRFAPRFIDAQRSYQVLLLDLHAVQQQSAQAQLR